MKYYAIIYFCFRRSCNENQQRTSCHIGEAQNWFSGANCSVWKFDYLCPQYSELNFLNEETVSKKGIVFSKYFFGQFDYEVHPINKNN